MPRFTRFFPLALLGTLLVWGVPTMTDPAQAASKAASTLTGDIRHHSEVGSRFLVAELKPMIDRTYRTRPARNDAP